MLLDHPLPAPPVPGRRHETFVRAQPISCEIRHHHGSYQNSNGPNAGPLSANEEQEDDGRKRELGDTIPQELGDTIVFENPDETKAGDSNVSQPEPTEIEVAVLPVFYTPKETHKNSQDARLLPALETHEHPSPWLSQAIDTTDESAGVDVSSPRAQEPTSPDKDAGATVEAQPHSTPMDVGSG